MAVDKKIDLVTVRSPGYQFQGSDELKEEIEKWKFDNPNTRIVDYNILPSNKDNDRHTVYIIYIETAKRELLTEGHGIN